METDPYTHGFKRGIEIGEHLEKQRVIYILTSLNEIDTQDYGTTPVLYSIEEILNMIGNESNASEE